MKTGEQIEINPSDIHLPTIFDISDPECDYDAPKLKDHFEFKATLKYRLQPKLIMRLHGLTNNYIRMHGGKPMVKGQMNFL